LDQEKLKLKLINDLDSNLLDKPILVSVNKINKNIIKKKRGCFNCCVCKRDTSGELEVKLGERVTFLKNVSFDVR